MVAAAVEDLAYATCLVCFGGVILVGFLALNLLNWRDPAVEVKYCCKKENNPVDAGRGCDASKIERGSANPFDGIDARLRKTHGHGLSKKAASKIVTAVGSSSSLL
jgi:hypothetical protein